MHGQKIEWQLVCETDLFLYYVGNNGEVIRKTKNGGKIKQCCTYMYHRKSVGTYAKYVKVNGKEYTLATLVYRSFSRTGLDSSKYYLAYKDGNRENCAFNNLVPISRKHIPSLAKATKTVCKPVVVQEYKQEPVVYPSVRAAARALYCSYQTLIDYLGNVRKKSVLKKYGRKIYYLEECNNV